MFAPNPEDPRFVIVPTLSEEYTEDEVERQAEARAHNRWAQLAIEGEAQGDCEHGLAAWLCNGPNHW